MSAVADPGPGDRGGTFASLANPQFRLLWFSGAFAFLTIGMQLTARGWLALELTDSNAALAAVMFAFGVGMLVSIPFGGVAADRFAKRTVVIGSHLGLAVSSVWLGAMVLANVEAFWMVVVVSATHGVAFAFMGPARVAFTGEIVDRLSLPNAVSLTQLTVSGTQIIGPSFAGFLIATPGVGTAGVYLITGALAAVGIVPMLRLPEGRGAQRVHRSPLRELADGVSYVRSQPRVSLVVGTTFLVVLVAFPFNTFLPKFADELFGVGAGWLGVLFAASALGGTVVTLRTARLRNPDAVWRLRLVTGYVIALGVGLLAITPNVVVAIPVLILLGGGALGFQTLNSSTALMMAEPAYHGRIQSLLMMAFSASSLASWPMGVLADAIGLRPLHLLMAGAAAIVMVVSAARGRAIEQAERSAS